MCHACTSESQIVGRDLRVTTFLELLHSRDTAGSDGSISPRYRMSLSWITYRDVNNIVNSLVKDVLGFGGEITIGSKGKLERVDTIMHKAIVQGEYSWIKYELPNMCGTAFMRHLDLHSASSVDGATSSPPAQYDMSISR